VNATMPMERYATNNISNTSTISLASPNRMHHHPSRVQDDTRVVDAKTRDAFKGRHGRYQVTTKESCYVSSLGGCCSLHSDWRTPAITRRRRGTLREESSRRIQVPPERLERGIGRSQTFDSENVGSRPFSTYCRQEGFEQLLDHDRGGAHPSPGGRQLCNHCYANKPVPARD
jgi:hypothetical protein